MRVSSIRLLRNVVRLYHENPLGLPRSGTPPSWPRPGRPTSIKGVRKVVAVSSAKGGVGKSTISANLSLSFAMLGYRAGILDVDIFGPSIPTLFNLAGEPRLSEDNRLLPLTGYGVKTMSMGYLSGDASPVVWRGPMVMKAVQQLLHQVDWGDLDVLVLDLPPGTGDTQLTIAQQVKLDGAVIVTTPHTLAAKDATKGVAMFRKVDVEILGLVRNMSFYACPHCGNHSHIFGSSDAVQRLCTDQSIAMLGDIPLDARLSEDADSGRPTVAVDPSSERSAKFIDVAQKVATKIGLTWSP